MSLESGVESQESLCTRYVILCGEMIPQPQEAPAQDSLEFVVFQVGGRNCAVPIHRVKEVLAYGNITPLPRAPSFLEGVIDLRGALIPVIDLRKRFAFEDISYSMQTRILVIRSAGKRIGVVVDSVLRVLPIALQNVQPPPEAAQIHGVDYILAFARHENELYAVLDLDRILTATESSKLVEIE